MARRKKRGGRRGMFAGLKSKGASLIGSAVQLLGLAHGVITGVGQHLDAPAQMPKFILKDYTGYNIDDGSFDQGQALKSASIIVVSWLVGKGIKYVGRH